MAPATSRPSHTNATNFSVVSSIASLQRLGPHPLSSQAAAVQAPPSSQRDLTSTQKLTTRKDSSVHAAAIRNASISTYFNTSLLSMMTSNLCHSRRCQSTGVVGIVLQPPLSRMARPEL